MRQLTLTMLNNERDATHLNVHRGGAYENRHITQLIADRFQTRFT